jgi:hypothetical protein
MPRRLALETSPERASGCGPTVIRRSQADPLSVVAVACRAWARGGGATLVPARRPAHRRRPLNPT